MGEEMTSRREYITRAKGERIREDECRVGDDPADSGFFQILARGLTANSGCFLNAPQRPSQPPQRNNLVSFLSSQNVAHIDRAYTPSVNVLSQFLIGRFSGDPVWPVLGDPRGL
jgi:hypothetical protein